MLAGRRDLAPVWDPGQGIRATVIGAAQFSVQTSGNTIAISRPDDLPLHNLPVLACDFELGDVVDKNADCSRSAQRDQQLRYRRRISPVALAFPVEPAIAFARASPRALPPGFLFRAGAPRWPRAWPIVLMIDGDVGMSLGRIIRNETAPGANVIAVDSVQLKQFDYVDIGRVIEITNVVPIIIRVCCSSERGFGSDAA